MGTITKPKYLYHSTSLDNFKSVLTDLVLVCGKGIAIAGYNEKEISLSDTLSRYLPIMFGRLIVKFKAQNLFHKNKIKPRIYECSEEDFEDMPFEEAEWKAKRVVFYLSDISKIYYIPHCLTDLVEIKRICLLNKLKLELKKGEKDFPDYDLYFFKKKYKMRIKYANR